MMSKKINICLNVKKFVVICIGLKSVRFKIVVCDKQHSITKIYPHKNILGN